MIETEYRPFVQPPTDQVRYAVVSSPIGDLTIVGDGQVVTHLAMPTHQSTLPVIQPSWAEDPQAFAVAQTELSEYFAGERRRFTFPMAPTGTEFQMSVWVALTQIPYGATATYGDIATAVGNPKASRAVGMANHHNPIAIAIPCHRVVGSNGSLTGYGGGLDRKVALLDLESGAQTL